MERKLFGIFTGWQITILLVSAIFAPGALYAAATFSNVAIVEPESGRQAIVDKGRRLYVYDPIAGFANNPENYVRISGSCQNTRSSFNYAPPAGKAIIVKAVDLSYYGGVSGGDNYAYLYGGYARLAGIDRPEAVGDKNVDLGNGIFVTNGETVFMNCTSSSAIYFATIAGFLVPANAVPASTDSGQSVVNTAEVKKGERRF